MMKYLIRRLLQLIPLLIVVSLLVFALLRFIPGDPAEVMAGPMAPPEAIERLRAEMGLDKPVWVQLIVWYKRLLRGDFGYSYFLQCPVATAIMQRLPVTAGLTLGGLLVTISVGIPLGILAAIYRGTLIDRTASLFATLGLAIPNFWLGLMFILVFAVKLQLVPAGGALWARLDLVEKVKTLILPSVAIGVMQAAIVERFTRASLLEVLREQYISTARMKGLSEGMVILKHALRNALVPVVTVLGNIAIGFVGGVVVIETVFSLPGMGRLVIEAVLARDYPVIQGALLFVAAVYALVNLFVDIIYTFINPRIRYA